MWLLITERVFNEDSFNESKSNDTLGDTGEHG